MGFRNLQEKLENKSLISCDFTQTEKLSVWPSGVDLQGLRGTAILFLNKVFTNLGMGNLGYLGCGLSGSLG